VHHQRAHGVVVAEVRGEARRFQHALDLLQLHGPVGIQIADRAAVADGFSQLHFAFRSPGGGAPDSGQVAR
jgi:hypothetical protein